MVQYDENDTRVVRDSHTSWSDGLARGLAGLALVLSLLALILAWSAYDRTGGALDERIQKGVSDAANSTVETTRDATNNAADAIDAGPDGVDNDDNSMTNP